MWLILNHNIIYIYNNFFILKLKYNFIYIGKFIIFQTLLFNFKIQRSQLIWFLLSSYNFLINFLSSYKIHVNKKKYLLCIYFIYTYFEFDFYEWQLLSDKNRGHGNLETAMWISLLDFDQKVVYKSLN